MVLKLSKYIWCISIGLHQFYPPPPKIHDLFLHIEAPDTILEKNCQTKIFSILLKNYSTTIFVAATKNNKFSGKWNLEELLHFVVATKKVDRILLQHYIGSRAKIFPRARTLTLPKLRLKIRKKWIFPWFSPICWRSNFCCILF